MKEPLWQGLDYEPAFSEKAVDIVDDGHARIVMDNGYVYRFLVGNRQWERWHPDYGTIRPRNR